jgi:hypothetical protein
MDEDPIYIKPTKRVVFTNLKRNSKDDKYSLYNNSINTVMIKDFIYTNRITPKLKDEIIKFIKIGKKHIKNNAYLEKVEIVAHTNRDYSYDYSNSLSATKAARIKNVITEHFEYSLSADISTRGYGREFPICTEENQQEFDLPCKQ